MVNDMINIISTSKISPFHRNSEAINMLLLLFFFEGDEAMNDHFLKIYCG